MKLNKKIIAFALCGLLFVCLFFVFPSDHTGRDAFSEPNVAVIPVRRSEYRPMLNNNMLSASAARRDVPTSHLSTMAPRFSVSSSSRVSSASPVSILGSGSIRESSARSAIRFTSGTSVLGRTGSVSSSSALSAPLMPLGSNPQLALSSRHGNHSDLTFFEDTPRRGQRRANGSYDQGGYNEDDFASDPFNPVPLGSASFPLLLSSVLYLIVRRRS